MYRCWRCFAVLCSYICYCQYALSIILEAYVFPLIFLLQGKFSYITVILPYDEWSGICECYCVTISFSAKEAGGGGCRGMCMNWKEK